MLVIKIAKGEKSRSVGMVTLDLSHYIDGDTSSKKKFMLEKCPDKTAYIELVVSSKLMNTMSGSESMSIMSGFENFDSMSIDSGPDSEFNFKEMEKEQEEDGVPRDVDLENIGIEASSVKR